MIIVNKTQSVLSFKEGKPTVFKLQQQQLPTVDFDALIKEISGSCGVGAAQTKSVVEALIDRMVLFMSMGHGVKLGEFGTFKPVITVHTVENATDADASTVKSKKIRFYPGKRFKEMLGSISVAVNGGDGFDGGASDSSEQGDKGQNQSQPQGGGTSGGDGSKGDGSLEL